MDGETRPGRNGGKLRATKPGSPGTKGAGRPLGSPNAKTVIKKWLDIVTESKNPVTRIKESLTQYDLIALAQLKKALTGDTFSFNALLDRAEGKPKQEVDQKTVGKLKIEIVRRKGNTDNS